ncbi:MAG: hypothetical protein KTR31_41100 [Myxococcales bacterium]|nr:hypothetical protein [Myxococcales bacterium]
METTDESLVQRLLADRDDAEAWAVYLDWLRDRGDDRAVLADSAEIAVELARLSADWFDDLDHRIAGPSDFGLLDPDEPRMGVQLPSEGNPRRWVTAVFDRGHVRKIRVRSGMGFNPHDVGTVDGTADLLVRLLTHEVGRLTDELEVHVLGPSAFVADTARRAGPLPVRRMRLRGDAFRNTEEGLDLRAVLDGTPRLRTLAIHELPLRLEPLRHDGLRILHLLLAREAMPEVLAWLGASELPALENLAIWMDEDGWGAVDLDVLLRTPLPSLHRLALARYPAGAGLLRELPRAVWFQQLTDLRCRIGPREEDVVSQIAPYGHLQRLLVSLWFPYHLRERAASSTVALREAIRSVLGPTVDTSPAPDPELPLTEEDVDW